MKTTTYDTILRDWANLCQLEYDQLLTAESETFRSSFNRHLRKVWDFMQWPETTVIEEWTEATSTASWDYSDKISVGHVLEVYDKDPRTNLDYKTYQFLDLDETIHLQTSDGGTSLWVKYVRLESRIPNSFETVQGSVSVGEYLKDSGEFYQLKAGTNATALPTTKVDPNGDWVWLYIPERFHSFLLHSTVADWGAVDESMNTAGFHRGIANNSLLDEAELMERRMQQSVTTKIGTYPHGW